MQRYADRDSYGPEFDDRLIRLVRAQPAIYDVNHHHYRRNPVRVAIWDRIAVQLGAPSKFIQTKWKNIRYNYLQEIKSLETGQINSNVRKRRFTEDLSFLLHKAQLYNVKKGSYKCSSYNSSDNDSNSFMYPDNTQNAQPNGFEIIEIEQSNDGSQEDFDLMEHLHNCSNEIFDKYGAPDVIPTTDNNKDEQTNSQHRKKSVTPNGFKVKGEGKDGETEKEEEQKLVTEEEEHEEMEEGENEQKADESVAKQCEEEILNSNPSSPLLTPLVIMDNGKNGNDNNIVADERQCTKVTEWTNFNDGVNVTVKKSLKSKASTSTQRDRVPPSEIMANAAKRKSMAAPFPSLTPINDPIELYCLSLVDSLRNMPRSERERVKYEFAKILKDAKYKDES